MSLAFIDCETTGLDPERAVVWEIGLITDSGEYEWVLELSAKELSSAEPTALAIGRFYERVIITMAATEEQWNERAHTFPPSITDPSVELRRQVAREKKFISADRRGGLANFIAHEIGNAHLVGAVPSFDARFVGDLLRHYGYPPSWHYHLVDVEALAAGKLGREPPWRSKDLYRELGIDPGYFNEHTALGDARMAKAVYEKVFNKPPSYPGALIPVGGDEPSESATQTFNR